MDSLEPKKLALLRILQIYQEYSDVDHPLKQEDILNILDRDYGIILERKAIGRNVSLLKEAGFEIESGHTGSYLSERKFTDSELRVLIDGVLSSNYITAKYSKDLIEKLCALSSKHFQSHVKHIYSVKDWNKTENKSVLYNIELVSEAIESKKKVRFEYNKYGADKKMHKTRAFYASPYQLILHNQRYYLMALEDYHKNVIFFRIDHITNMTITDIKLIPLKDVEGYEHGIDYRELSSSRPYMFNDKPEQICFYADEAIIDQIIDWFGIGIQITKGDGARLCITLKASPNAMEHWALQYAGYVTVVSPQSLVNQIKKRLDIAKNDYSV